MSVIRSSLEAVLGLVVAASCLQAAPPPAEVGRRPNILIIVADGLALSELGCFGSTAIRTPNLDRLASEGVRMTDFYAASPGCSPARASLLTGRYPQRHGLDHEIRNDLVDYGHQYTEAEYAISPEMTLGLDVREILISQPLSRAGYTCGAVGKWDTGRARRFLPLQRDFDAFYGFATTGIDYWTHERYGIPSLFRDNERIREEGYTTDLFLREATRFIEASRDRPFFLYLAFNAPHSASNLDREHRLPQAPEDALAPYAHVASRSLRARYACITKMDEAIGDVLELLQTRRIADDTLVLFCSAYGRGGMSRGVPLNVGKAQLFDGGLRTPFLGRWPGHIPAGTTRRDFITALDLYPTLLAAAGVPPPADHVLDGFDLLPTLAGEQPSPRKEMFWQHNDQRAARIGPYKWVESEGQAGIFDLNEDEGEQHDLSTKRPDLGREMKRHFESWQREMVASEPRGPFRDY